ncbi:MAG: hypothetical protein QXN63_00785 [Candidatus Bathyarchaeia archaeon]
MRKPLSLKGKYCGNCHYHNSYNYPDQIFCMYHYVRHENHIYPTLSVCEHWEPDTQECYCVEEAQKKQEAKR